MINFLIQLPNIKFNSNKLFKKLYNKLVDIKKQYHHQHKQILIIITSTKYDIRLLKKLFEISYCLTSTNNIYNNIKYNSATNTVNVADRTIQLNNQIISDKYYNFYVYDITNNLCEVVKIDNYLNYLTIDNIGDIANINSKCIVKLNNISDITNKYIRNYFINSNNKFNHSNDILLDYLNIIKCDKLIELHTKCMTDIKLNYNKWYPVKMTFCNMYGYATNTLHTIEFNNGISYLDNFEFKTSIINILVFGVFGKSPPKSNLIDMINVDEQIATVKVEFVSNNIVYMIERKLKRRMNNTNNLKTMEDHEKILTYNNATNINFERGQQVEYSIRKICGTVDNFYRLNIFSDIINNIFDFFCLGELKQIEYLKSVFGLDYLGLSDGVLNNDNNNDLLNIDINIGNNLVCNVSDNFGDIFNNNNYVWKRKLSDIINKLVELNNLLDKINCRFRYIQEEFILVSNQIAVLKNEDYKLMCRKNELELLMDKYKVIKLKYERRIMILNNKKMLLDGLINNLVNNNMINNNLIDNYSLNVSGNVRDIYKKLISLDGLVMKILNDRLVILCDIINRFILKYINCRIVIKYNIVGQKELLNIDIYRNPNNKKLNINLLSDYERFVCMIGFRIGIGLICRSNCNLFIIDKLNNNILFDQLVYSFDRLIIA